MIHPPLLEGLSATTAQTSRLNTHIISAGPENGDPVIFIHGNGASARSFEELLTALPGRFRGIALDLRGYGRSEAAPVDATRGVRDFSDDLHALIETLDLPRPHLVGWSLGGSTAMQYAIDFPNDVASLTLIAPGSPYGFGGTHDLDGTPNNPEFSGTGAGLTNPEFLQRLQDGDRSEESPVSPRNVVRGWFNPPFRPPREDVWVDELLRMTVGPDHFPGDSTPSSFWPGVAPGARGVNNALSPKYYNLSSFAQITPRPPVLWARGDADMLISDKSTRDVAILGMMGLFPDWPGPEIYPPQPMVSQTQAVLDRYQANGGVYREIVFAECGHAPHVEKPEEFQAALFAFLDEAVTV